MSGLNSKNVLANLHLLRNSSCGKDLIVHGSSWKVCVFFISILTRTEVSWPSGLYSLRQVTEVKLGRVRSDFGWVTAED